MAEVLLVLVLLLWSAASPSPEALSEEQLSSESESKLRSAAAATNAACCSSEMGLTRRPRPLLTTRGWFDVGRDILALGELESAITGQEESLRSRSELAQDSRT